MTPENLNVLLNTWQEGTHGHEQERTVILALDTYGHQIGFGALKQLAEALYQVQCHKNANKAAVAKRERFAELDWPLPKNFERIVKEGA